jgi:hypothetical protein
MKQRGVSRLNETFWLWNAVQNRRPRRRIKKIRTPRFPYLYLFKYLEYEDIEAQLFFVKKAVSRCHRE